MRLSNRIINILQQGILKSFGDIDVYLFGSRTDDKKTGGDIDIALDVCLTKEEFRKKKIFFKSYLARVGFDLKIDVVNFNTTDPLLRQEIQKNKISLISTTIHENLT
ncbi:nucleotidyltransferase domain-containing protein [Thiotrichales bacterium HSG1]|nr:nucleotidyltransferase domain-containing protein [Thiotrichales bacterium HSG1]